MTNKSDQIELLDDLLHDLGKYIAFPLNMLPVNPDEALFRDSVDQALNRTRTGPNGTQSARSIWESFLDEAGNGFDNEDGWQRIHGTVETALSWGKKLAEPSLINEQQRVVDDLRAVSVAIRQLRDKING